MAWYGDATGITRTGNPVSLVPFLSSAATVLFGNPVQAEGGRPSRDRRDPDHVGNKHGQRCELDGEHSRGEHRPGGVQEHERGDVPVIDNGGELAERIEFPGEDDLIDIDSDGDKSEKPVDRALKKPHHPGCAWSDHAGGPQKCDREEHS